MADIVPAAAIIALELASGINEPGPRAECLPGQNIVDASPSAAEGQVKDRADLLGQPDAQQCPPADKFKPEAGKDDFRVFVLS